MGQEQCEHLSRKTSNVHSNLSDNKRTAGQRKSKAFLLLHQPSRTKDFSCRLHRPKAQKQSLQIMKYQSAECRLTEYFQLQLTRFSYRIASKIQRISPGTFSYGHVNHNAKSCRHELTRSNNQITSRNCMTWQNLLSWNHLTCSLSFTKFETKHKLWIIELQEVNVLNGFIRRLTEETAKATWACWVVLLL